MDDDSIRFFNQRAQIRKIYDFPGSFKELVHEKLKSRIVPKQRKGAFHRSILKEAGRLLPEVVSAHNLDNQLAEFPVLSVADHHGLLNHHLLYQSNILYAEILKELNLKTMCVLATGNIPLLNVSHPRGFYFKKEKFNFFRKKDANTPVFLLKEKLNADRNAGLESFIVSYPKESLSSDELQYLETLFFHKLEIENASLNYHQFSDQVTLLNNRIWKSYFDENIRHEVPDLIYLQANQIILDALLEELNKPESLLLTILFDPEIRKIYLKNFLEIPGCWGANRGSHFFWGISERNSLTSLRFSSGCDYLLGENIFIPYRKEEICRELRLKRIIPTLFIDMLIITFLEGYAALGGFNQIEYLHQMQQAHIKSLKEAGMNNLADLFASRITDGLICGMAPLPYHSGLDMIWHYNSKDGRFSGNINRGLTHAELDVIKNKKVRDLIESGISTISQIVDM
jgi:hypothetical protein